MGKIKKITENELVGGTQNTDVYPVTSVKAVYDESNERLDNILNRRGVVNISTNYNADHIAEVLTLEQAIAKVPSKDRVLGFQGKFLSENGWKSYVFIGDSIADWTNKTKWNNYLTGTDIVQESGEAEDKVMSQKAVRDKLSDLKEIVDIYGIELVPSEDNIGWYSGGDYHINEPEGETYGHYIYNVEGINSDIFIRTRLKNPYTALYGLFDKNNQVLSYGDTTDKQQKCYLDLSKYPTASKLLVNFIISEKEGTIVYRAYRENEVVDPYVHPDYNVGWIPKERTIYTVLLDNNFWHSIYKIDKSKDITFSGISTDNPYYYYFLYLDSYGRTITQGSLINTGNEGVTTINKEDIPESAVFAVIHYKSSEKPIYSNGNTYTVSAEYIYHRTNYVSENDIKNSIYNVRTDAFVNYGWVLNNVWHSTDKNFVVIALRLDKTSNLFVKNAASDNAYFNYIDFRDSSFKNVGGLKQTSNTEDTLTPEDYPENAVYAIIHIAIHIFSNKLYEINNGVKTAFLTTEEFANRMDAINNNKEIADDILLPPIIYAVVDDTLQIFYEDIFYGNNINDWSFKVRCSKGKNFPRYFEYTPTTNDVGETNLEISLVRKSSKKDIYPENSVIATAKLVTIPKAQSPSKEKHILCIGDSTLAASNGLWGRECARRLVSTGGIPNADAIKNIKFTGRLHADIDSTNVFGYEGNSGWQWSTYISSSQKAIRFYVNGVSSVSLGAKYRSPDGQVYDIAEVNITGGVGNIRCTYPMQASFPTPPSSGKLIRVYGDGDNEITYTSINEESYSPFITDGVFDFTNYINTHCGGSIDVLAISLGINFIVNIVNNNMSDIDSSLGSSVRTFLDKFHEQYPNAKVIIGTLQKASLLGGFGYNFGANEIADGDYYHRKLYALNKEYIKIASEDKYANFVYLANVNAEFDARHCYPQIDKKVNVRNSSTEKIDTNFGHLTESGYMMMSDSFYRCITYLLNKVL